MFRWAVTFFLASVGVLLFGVPTAIIGLFDRSRRALAWGANAWGKLIMRASGCRLVIKGYEHVHDGEPKFFVGNHQSALDIPVMLVALGGRVSFLAKRSLFDIPVFGWVLRLNGYVPLNRKNARKDHARLVRMLEDLARHPISYCVFPEGTRSMDGQLLPFRRGALKICQRSGLAVVPFSINGSLAAHARGGFVVTPGEIQLTFAKPIPAEVVKSMDMQQLHDRVVDDVAAGLEAHA